MIANISFNNYHSSIKFEGGTFRFSESDDKQSKTMKETSSIYFRLERFFLRIKYSQNRSL